MRASEVQGVAVTLLLRAGKQGLERIRNLHAVTGSAPARPAKRRDASAHARQVRTRRRYTLSPASPVSRFCTNGAWDLAPPTCTPVTCTALSAPANGAYLYEPSSMLYPTWATLKCNAGA